MVCSREQLLVNMKVLIILQIFRLFTSDNFGALKPKFRPLISLRKENVLSFSSGDALTPRSSMEMISSSSNSHQGMEENNASRENNSQELSTPGPSSPSSAQGMNACSNQGLFFTIHHANSHTNNAILLPTDLCAIYI